MTYEAIMAMYVRLVRTGMWTTKETFGKLTVPANFVEDVKRALGEV